MSWIQTLTYPFMQHAVIAIFFAGITFPMIGVSVISLNLIPLRFAMMHIALLGGAVGLFLKVDPLLMGLLFCALSSLALGPLSERMKLGLGTLSGYFMTLSLALAFILIYKANFVPVGIDQLPHLELTREICRRFNAFYGEVFPEPQPLMTEYPKLPGTDGRKMSKSYGNCIYLSDPPKIMAHLPLWAM
jgi:hypothetical protein